MKKTGRNFFMSNIHGYYEPFKQLLKEVSFGKDDFLYIIGDCIDSGPQSLELLDDLMMRENIFAVMGEHEFYLMCFLKGLQKKEEGSELSAAQTQRLMAWLSDGGAPTMEAVGKLSAEERDSLLDYLEDMDIYLELEIGGKEYLCVHTGISGDHTADDLEDMELEEILSGGEEAATKDVPGKILVTGHTPVFDETGLPSGKIFADGGHVRLDCGAACGGRLGIYCAETGECTYVQV